MGEMTLAVCNMSSLIIVKGMPFFVSKQLKFIKTILGFSKTFLTFTFHRPLCVFPIHFSFPSPLLLGHLKKGFIFFFLACYW